MLTDETLSKTLQQVQRLPPDADIHLMHLREDKVLVLVQASCADQSQAGHRLQPEVPLVLLLGGDEGSEQTAGGSHVLLRAELVDVDAHVEGFEEDLMKYHRGEIEKVFFCRIDER